jgi:hypothetical protein
MSLKQGFELLQSLFKQHSVQLVKDNYLSSVSQQDTSEQTWKHNIEIGKLISKERFSERSDI